MTDKTHISIRHINKIYGDGTKALHDINLDVKEGEILVLLGSSGCGKSTLLRIIAGLEKKTDGEIYFYDQEITGIPVEKRNIGFVFQNYALFPTMTVRENIAFGLKLQKLSKNEINERVDKLADMLNLHAYIDKKPQQLSGGQQQRVAIARVLAIKPKILLLDEPLTALDAKLKDRLRIELGQMLHRLGITTVYVTHDQLEAMAIADRVAIINKGDIEQLDAPEDIYLSPKTAFTAQFIGKINKLDGKICKVKDKLCIDLGFDTVSYTGMRDVKEGTEVSVYLRPEDISIVTDQESGEGTIKAVIEQSIFMGGYYQIAAKAADQIFMFDVANMVKLRENEEIRIKIDKNKLIAI